MINAKDFRIGNMIQSPNTKGFMTTWQIQQDDMALIIADPEKYFPVDLTKDWLNLFSKEIDNTYHFEDLIIHVGKENTFAIQYCGVNLKIKIDKVHQLQNFWFGVTGKELQMT